VKFGLSLSKPRKQPFLLSFSKSRGGKAPFFPLLKPMYPGKNAKLGGQTLFSMCFQNICYKSHVTHLSVLDEFDTEDATHVQSSSNKITNPR